MTLRFFEAFYAYYHVFCLYLQTVKTLLWRQCYLPWAKGMAEGLSYTVLQGNDDELKDFLREWEDDSDCVVVHTSGSTGKPRPMSVEKTRMKASATATCSFLGLHSGDTALLCMPLRYIAGKMVVVRSIVQGLHLLLTEPSSHPLRGLQDAPVFAAMVPMQVVKSLENEDEARLLRQVRHLIIGGGAVDESLEKTLRTFPNNVYSTYGMTETLSHIALRRLSGNDADEWYTPFSNVSVSISSEGCIIIDAPDVCSEPLTTNDIGEMNADGRRFRILGRKDNVVCSGGIKLQIESLEKDMRQWIDTPFMLSKVPDRILGEALVMMSEKNIDPHIRLTLKENLGKSAPRHYLVVDHLPMTETSKPARKVAEDMCRTLMGI